MLVLLQICGSAAEGGVSLLERSGEVHSHGPPVPGEGSDSDHSSRYYERLFQN